MKDLSNTPTDKLITWYINAIASTSCLGHFKREQNEFFASKYAEELESRDVKTDGLYESLRDKAQFNGEGSW